MTKCGLRKARPCPRTLSMQGQSLAPVESIVHQSCVANGAEKPRGALTGLWVFLQAQTQQHASFLHSRPFLFGGLLSSAVSPGVSGEPLLSQACSRQNLPAPLLHTPLCGPCWAQSGLLPSSRKRQASLRPHHTTLCPHIHTQRLTSHYTKFSVKMASFFTSRTQMGTLDP